MVIALVVASFVGSLYSLTKNQASAFYLPQYRMWELGTGALLAIASVLGRPSRAPPGSLARRCRFLCGPRTCAWLRVIAWRTRSFPGFFAWAPVAGALLLIAAGPRALVNRRALAHPVLVFVGVISYPLYLWHWPLLSFAHILGLGSDTAVVATALLAAAALAVATFLYIEKPIRRLGAPTSAPALVVLTLMIAGAGMLAHHGRLLPQFNAPEYREIETALADWGYPDGLQKAQGEPGARYFRAGQPQGATLFFGDSNVEQYWPRVQRLREQSPQPVLFVTIGGCAPIPGVETSADALCAGFGERAARLAADPSVGALVIFGAWSSYFGSSAHKFRGAPLEPGSAAWDGAFEALGQTLRAFTSRGKPAWLVLGIPKHEKLAIVTSVRRSLSGAVALQPLEVARSAVDTGWSPIRQRLVATAHAAGAHVIDPMDSLCGSRTRPGRTPDGRTIYKDAGHLRASYVREHAVFIDQTLGMTTGSIR